LQQQLTSQMGIHFFLPSLFLSSLRKDAQLFLLSSLICIWKPAQVPLEFHVKCPSKSSQQFWLPPLSLSRSQHVFEGLSRKAGPSARRPSSPSSSSSRLLLAPLQRVRSSPSLSLSLGEGSLARREKGRRRRRFMTRRRKGDLHLDDMRKRKRERDSEVAKNGRDKRKGDFPSLHNTPGTSNPNTLLVFYNF
jgi:hypothetical protein